jgi:UDP-perosamine 4-acetyltransferase
MTNLLILGTGGHARAVIESALSSGEIILGLVDINYTNQKEEILGVRVLGGVDVLKNYNPRQTSVVVAIGNNGKRREWALRLKKMGFVLPSIIHPTAILSQYADIGEGVFISCGAIVNTEAIIGDNVIINTGTIVEHEVKIGENCHLAPGVKVGGRVSIGNNTFIGIGSSVADYINIGRDVTIGAGSVIIKNVEDESKVVGVGRVIP